MKQLCSWALKIFMRRGLNHDVQKSAKKTGFRFGILSDVKKGMTYQ